MLYGAQPDGMPPGTHTEAVHLPSKHQLQGAAKHVRSVNGAGAVAKAVQFHLIAPATLAVWLGADRWCVQPLRHIRDFADRVARGDDMKLESGRPWGPELSSVADAVVCVATPTPFAAIGQWYRDFSATSDAEVVSILDHFSL